MHPKFKNKPIVKTSSSKNKDLVLVMTMSCDGRQIDPLRSQGL